MPGTAPGSARHSSSLRSCCLQKVARPCRGLGGCGKDGRRVVHGSGARAGTRSPTSLRVLRVERHAFRAHDTREGLAGDDAPPDRPARDAGLAVPYRLGQLEAPALAALPLGKTRHRFHLPCLRCCAYAAVRSPAEGRAGLEHRAAARGAVFAAELPPVAHDALRAAIAIAHPLAQPVELLLGAVDHHEAPESLAPQVIGSAAAARSGCAPAAATTPPPSMRC